VSTPRPFLHAEWRQLLMVNYEVDAAALLPRVPAGVVLDLHDGRALVSVVGFRFLRTRLLGIPVPLHRDFDEVNLRFYVRREMPDGTVRRGVTFVRELVPRAAIAVVARLAYNEPYRALPMRSVVPAGAPDAAGALAFEWRRGGRWERVAARTHGDATPLVPGSEAEFITEHYWGYTRQRDGGTVEYQVLHPPWRVRDAQTPVLDMDVATLYGPEFVGPLAGPPASAFVATGSAVTVHRPRRLER
jgi:uncharacterized protein YqjF (DUF2071 family)